MPDTDSRMIKLMVDAGLRPSHPRIKILGYLVGNYCHPTAADIYSALKGSMPTLSKTTVYNTLDALADAKLIRSVSVDDTESRYDFVTQIHGHFLCEGCGDIHDFELPKDLIANLDLEGHEVTSKDVYFRGLCPRCRT